MKRFVLFMLVVLLCGCAMPADRGGKDETVSKNLPENTVSESVFSDNENTPENAIRENIEDIEDIFPINYYSRIESLNVVQPEDGQYRQYYENLGGSWLSYYDSYMDILNGNSEILDFYAYGTSKRNAVLEQYTFLTEALGDAALDAEIKTVMTSYGVDDETIGCYVGNYIQRADACVYSVVRKCMIGELEQGETSLDIYLKTCLYNGYFGYTFDSQTGKRLTLADVITDQDLLPELIVTFLEEIYQETVPEETIAELLRGDALSWSLGYQGITFYIQSEQIGIEDIRIYQVPILFAAKPDLFADKYCDIPEYYAMQYDFMEGVAADTDNDGKAEWIDMGRWEDVADKFEDAWVRNVRLILVSGKNGNVFLYIYTDGTLDFSGEAAVYDLAGEMPAYISTDGELIERKRLIDPAYVTSRMSDEFMLFGVYAEQYNGIGRIYRISDISATGIRQETGDTWFYERWNTLYEVVNPIEGIIVNIDGEEQGEQINLTEGMQVMAFRTDRHSYIDFILEDGRLCRLIADEDNDLCYFGGQFLANYFKIAE